MRLTRALLATLFLCAPLGGFCEGVPLYFRYQVLESRSHGATAFTEGLVFRVEDDLVLESTGLVGKSTVSAYQLSSHKTVARFTNPRGEFGEGLAFVQVEDTPKKLLLAQLTYRRKVVHFLDPDTLRLVDTKRLPPKFREGWGLTTGIGGTTLVMSDGSGVLYHLRRDPKLPQLVVVKTVTVHDCSNRMAELRGINELEKIPAYVTHEEHRRHVRGAPPWVSSAATYNRREDVVDEFVWANVIGTWCIAVINPNTGSVEAWIDISGLDPSFDRFNRVANGIAYRVSDDSIWLTGKNWRKTYRVKLVRGKANGFSILRSCRTPWHVQMSAYKKPQCT